MRSRIAIAPDRCALSWATQQFFFFFLFADPHPRYHAYGHRTRAAVLDTTWGRPRRPEWTTKTRYFPVDGGRAGSQAELYVLVAPDPLTGEAFDSVPVHKRKLGELRIYFNLASHFIGILAI